MRRPKLILEIKLMQKALSANQMHYASHKRDTVKYRRYRQAIKDYLGGDYNIHPKDKMKLSLVVGFSSKLSDLDNAFKPLLDSMQSCMGFDDRQIFEIEALKDHVKKGDEYIMIRLERITDITWKSRIQKLFKKLIGES